MFETRLVTGLPVVHHAAHEGPESAGCWVSELRDHIVRFAEERTSVLNPTVDESHAPKPEGAERAHIIVSFICNGQRRTNVALTPLRVASPCLHTAHSAQRYALQPPVTHCLC